MNQFRDENVHKLCIQIANICSFNALNSSYCLLQRLFTLKMAHLSHYLYRAFFRFGIHQQICTCKQHIQLMIILSYATIAHLCKAESIFDDMKCVLNSLRSTVQRVSFLLPPWATTSTSTISNPRFLPTPFVFQPNDRAKPPGLRMRAISSRWRARHDAFVSSAVNGSPRLS